MGGSSRPRRCLSPPLGLSLPALKKKWGGLDSTLQSVLSGLIPQLAHPLLHRAAPLPISGSAPRTAHAPRAYGAATAYRRSHHRMSSMFGPPAKALFTINTRADNTTKATRNRSTAFIVHSHRVSTGCQSQRRAESDFNSWKMVQVSIRQGFATRSNPVGGHLTGV